MQNKLLYLIKMCSKYFLIGIVAQCFFYSLIFADGSNAQIKSIEEVTVNVKLNNGSFAEFIAQVEQQTDFTFFYGNLKISKIKHLNLRASDRKLIDVLKAVSQMTGLSFRQVNYSIGIFSKDFPEPGFVEENAMYQGRTVTGRITSSDNPDGLPGVNIIVKGTMQGTVSDVNGNYSIEVPSEESVLVYSSVGYTTEEITVGTQAVINVTMMPDITSLEEIVVVGYGVQKRENLTGSVVAVSGDELIKRQVGQTSMALQGVAPGVTVTQRSGQPGNDAGRIRIRGIGTLGDSNPLVLVDGVEMNINNIDPNVIESISILKDAASASIYGSRAANGVILITTKRAKENAFSISYSGYMGYQTPTDLRDMVNAKDHMELLNIAYKNAGKSPIFDEDMVRNYDELHRSDPVTYPDVDWQDKVYSNNGFTQNHFVTLNGGNDRIKVLAALGYYDQQGLIENTNFKRYTVRLNSDIKISERLSTRMDIFLRQMEDDEPGTGTQGTNNLIYWLNRMPATQPVVNPDGSYAIGWDGDNPYAMALSSGYRENLTPSVLMNLGFTYQFIEGLKLDFNYSPHFWEDHYKDFRRIISTYYADGTLAYEKPGKSSLTQKNTRNLQNNLRTTLTYDKSFRLHNLKVMAGFQQEDLKSRWFSGFRDNFVLPDYDVLASGSQDNQQSNGSGSDWALRSYFGRLNYDFAMKYLFEANIRYDGSSRFATDHKWGVFPSFSAGWRVSEEDFWKPLSSAVNDLKLRASWGQLGNQNIGTYPFDSFVSLGASYVFNGNVVNGAALTDMANSRISWEKTEMLNFGIEATVLNNLSFTFEYYIRNTSDILLRLDVPKIIGLTEPYQNAGEVENKGWDLGLNYAGQKGDFSYDLGFTLSDVKNKVLDLKGINNTNLLTNREEYPMESIFALEAEGIFTDDDDIASHAQQFGNYKPGDIKYKDQLTVDTDGDGVFDAPDGVINDDDRIVIGNTIPRFTFGFTANLAWKAFDLNLLLQGVGKADGYLYAQSVMPFFLGGTAQEVHKDYWTPENPDATFPRLVFNEPNNEKNSSFWMKDASYMRMKNLQIGYTVPESWLKPLNIRKVRLYVSGQNLFTLDNFWDGFDVEAPVGNGSYYPQVKVYTLGLDVNF